MFRRAFYELKNFPNQRSAQYFHRVSAVESEEVLTLMNDLDCFFNLPIRTERRALSLGSFVKKKKKKKKATRSSSGVIYEEYCILNELVKCAFIHTLQQQQQEECASSFDDNNRFFGVFTL